MIHALELLLTGLLCGVALALGNWFAVIGFALCAALVLGTAVQSYVIKMLRIELAAEEVAGDE